MLLLVSCPVSFSHFIAYFVLQSDSESKMYGLISFFYVVFDCLISVFHKKCCRSDHEMTRQPYIHGYVAFMDSLSEQESDSSLFS